MDPQPAMLGTLLPPLNPAQGRFLVCPLSHPHSSHYLCLPCRLAGSKITAQGASHLVQALPLCPQLEEIR